MENNQSRLNTENEIELMDLLVVLWKRKWLIVIGTLVCAITAGIVAFNMPKIYEVSSSIEMGKVDSGFVEESPVISRKIKSISSREKIAQELSVPIEEIGGEDFLKISSESSKNFLIITTKIETDKPNQGIKILEIINQDILKDHQKKVEEAKKELSDKIALNQTKIKDTEAQIESLKKELADKIALNQNKIKDTEAQIESLKKELADKIAINENLIKIKEEKRKTLEKQLSDIQKEIVALQQIRETINKGEIEKVDVIGMVAYFNDFQARLNSLYYTQSQIVDQIPSQIQSYEENIATLQVRLTSLDGLSLKIRSYEEEIATLEGKLVKLDGLPLRIQSYKEEIATLQGKLTKLDDLPLKIRSYEEEITTLEGKLEKIRETKVIDAPHSSYYPVKPQKKKILAIAGIAGLLISVLLAFFLDYVEKYRKSGT